MNAGRCVLTALVLSVPCAGRVQAVDNVERELKSLSARVSSFRVVPCARSGEMRLTITQSLTIENLRGVRLDDNPPELGELTEPYDANQTDDFDDGTAPYVAKGIVPFRFRYFNCEFNYGGWHNLKMQEYAATHGFNILYPYTRKTSQRSRLPAGTRWLKWGGFVSWDEWMTKHGIPAGRYDMLADLDVAGELVKGDLLKGDNPALWDYLMIDMEHGVLSPADLHKQIWFPRTGSAADKAAFEKRYYHGYALTYTAAMTAAKRLGYRNLSVYGWEPFPRTWWGLDQLQFDPAAYAPWLLYGREIHDSPATDALSQGT